MSKRKPRLRRTARAEEDLIDIWAYVARDNPAAADRLLDLLDEKSQALARTPQIGMAREDGYQLLRRLREAGYGPDVLPAIALTAFSRMKDRNEALQAGFQEHLVKPLEPQQLLARVASLRHGSAL